MTRSKAQWYEFGEKNNKYFYNLEKINHKKKHITLLTKEDGNIVLEPKQILEEEERFFKEIYQSKNVCPESANLEHFFDGLNTLKQEEADTCERLLTLEECTNVWFSVIRESSLNMTRRGMKILRGFPKIFRHPKGGL